MPTVVQPSYSHCEASWSFIDHVFFCVLPDSWHKSGSHLPLCLAKRCEGGFPLCSCLYSVLSRNIYQILSDSSFLTVQCATVHSLIFLTIFYHKILFDSSYPTQFLVFIAIIYHCNVRLFFIYYSIGWVICSESKKKFVEVVKFQKEPKLKIFFFWEGEIL